MLQWILECMCLFRLVLFKAMYQEVKLLGRMAVLYLTFWGTIIQYSIVGVPFYSPTNSTQGFPFLHILTNTCHLWSFWWQLFWQVWDGIFLWFWCIYPWLLVMLNIFPCVCWLSICLFWGNVDSGPLPIIMSSHVVWFFFDVELFGCFVYSKSPSCRPLGYELSKTGTWSSAT